MCRLNYVIGRNEYQFLHCQNLPFLRYIHCNVCLNPLIIIGDMKENASGCFFLKTVYIYYCICIRRLSVCLYCPSCLWGE